MSYNQRDARLVKIGRKSYNHRKKKNLSPPLEVSQKSSSNDNRPTSGKAETRGAGAGPAGASVGETVE